MDFNNETMLLILLAVFFIFYCFSWCNEKYENYVMDETKDYSKNTFDNLELNLSKIIEKSDNNVMPNDETSEFLGREIGAQKYSNGILTDSGKEVIKKFSPFMYDSGCKTFTSFGNKFYYDYRFPARPIEVEFANDPEQYTKSYPKRYPSYLIDKVSC